MYVTKAQRSMRMCVSYPRACGCGVHQAVPSSIHARDDFSGCETQYPFDDARFAVQIVGLDATLPM